MPPARPGSASAPRGATPRSTWPGSCSRPAPCNPPPERKKAPGAAGTPEAPSPPHDARSLHRCGLRQLLELGLAPAVAESPPEQPERRSQYEGARDEGGSDPEDVADRAEHAA